MKNTNPVVHFEMPYEDAARVSEFYSKTFGWNMHQLGSEMMGYITAGTAETDENRMVKRAGAINGGFFQKKPDVPVYPSVVISVEDIKEAMEKVASAGGKVLEGPMEIPGIGSYATFSDTEGNRVSMLQPKST